MDYGKGMRRHADIMRLSYEDYRDKFRLLYNGYRYYQECESRVYNP